MARRFGSGTASSSFAGRGRKVGSAVIGGKEVVRMLRAMPDEVTDKKFRALMRRSFQITRRQAQENAKAAGLLHRPKFGVPPNPAKVIKLEQDKYAPYLRPAFNIGPIEQFFHLRLFEGALGSPSKPHKIEPSTKTKLTFEGTKGWAGVIVSTKSVNHPGHGVRPWLRPALYSTYTTVVSRMNEGMRTIVHKYFRRMGAK